MRIHSANRISPRTRYQLHHALNLLESLEHRLLLSTFTVTSNADSGAGSLRAQINAAEAAHGVQIITLNVTGPINLVSPLPALTDGIGIQTPATNPNLPAIPNVVINANNTGPVFTIAANGNVTLARLDITGGNASGILNLGNLTVIDCYINHNTNIGGNGGGILDAGNLILEYSTVASNSASNGAGIYITPGQPRAQITDSTITLNTAALSGGGISGDIRLVDSTIASNTAPTGAGIFTSDSVVGGSIIAANTGGDIALSATPTFAGDHNLVGDGSDNNIFTSSLSGSSASPLDPKLGALANNGGPTPTLALLPGSPAIGTGFDYLFDNGGPNNLLSFNVSLDQTGKTNRPDVSPDIGAFEIVPPHLVFHSQPTSTVIGQPMSTVVVYIEDTNNNIITTDNSNVILGVANAGGLGTSSGNIVAAVNGIATFTNYSFNLPLTGAELFAGDGPDTEAGSTPFNFLPAPAASLRVTSATPSNVVAGVPLGTITIEVDDQFGNIATASSAKVTINVDGKNVTVTASHGVATFKGLDFTTSGNASIRATSTGLQTGNQFEFIVAPAPVAKLVLSIANNTAFAGELFNNAGVALEVTATDKFGNIRDDQSNINFKITSGPAGGVITNPPNDIGFLALSLNKLGKYTLVASEANIKSNTSPVITVVTDFSDGPRVVFLTPPGDARATERIPPVQVALEDAGGNIITSENGNFEIYIKELEILSRVTTNFVNGLGTFRNITVPTPGTYHLEAEEFGQNGFSSFFYDSSAFNITAAPTTHLVFTNQPTVAAPNQIAGPFTVEVRDGNNQLLTGDNSAVTLSVDSGPTGGAIAGTLTEPVINGVATFSNITFSKTGFYSLQAADFTLIKIFTAPIANVLPVTHIAFFVQPITTVADKSITPSVVVRVLDSQNNPIVNNTDTITLTASSGTTPVGLGGTTTLHAVGGVATFTNPFLDATGNYSLTATDGNFTAKSSTFSIIPDVNTSILAIPTPPAPTLIGKPIPLVVKIIDEFGNVETTNNSKVTLTVTTGPGAFPKTITATASKGIATFSTAILNTAGNYTLTATDSTLANSTPVTFAQVITPGITTISVTKPASSYTFGQTLTLSATLKSTAPTSIPFTGNVTLLNTADNSVAATAAITSTGTVKFTLSNFAANTYNFTLSYPGDTNHSAITSSPITVLIKSATTTTTLKSSVSSLHSTTPITLTATVTSSSAIPRTGNIVFKDAGLTIATIPLSANTAATTYTPAILGTHTYTATYVPDNSNYLASFSSSLNVKLT